MLIGASINLPLTVIVGFPAGPVPGALGLFFHIENANAPGLYEFDRYGYVRPGLNRPTVTAEEQGWMDRYNRDRSNMVDTDRQALDDFLDKNFAIARRPSQVPGSCNRDFRSAITPPRRDPLAIDLDGDGIETVGIPTTGIPILFDHDADGVKTGTGWLKGDDAWLVLDRDGNGTIDSGRELFGVDTVITRYGPTLLPYQGNALDGFGALRDLDGANAAYPTSSPFDGVFDSRDSAFGQVRLWRDLNQDGVSQANELSTLASLGITAINLNPDTVNTNLGNGNSVSGTATVVRNGSNTVVAGVDLAASNLGLANNGFYRQFPPIPVGDAARALPEMGGSGWMRDLREAMSGGTGSAALTAAVQQFAQATTRDVQLAAVDGLLAAWAATSGKLNTEFAFDPARGTARASHVKSPHLRSLHRPYPTQPPIATPARARVRGLLAAMCCTPSTNRT
jgi:hypothetical protein